MARYWDKKDKHEYIVEVFKNKIPMKEGLKDYRGYKVVLNGSFEKGSTVCEFMGIDWGMDSATRYLWHHFNKIANENGVEEPDETYESWGF